MPPMSDVMTATRREYPALDALRGLAAFLVVLGHTRSLVLGSQGLPPAGEGWQTIALLPTGFAQEAVAIFFVLSGYLVGGQVLRKVRLSRFTWRDYIARRVSRLYVVLVPGVVFTLVLDTVLRQFPARLHPSFGVEATEPLGRIVCNLVFLQESRCRPIGSNDSLWSLSYEFWFYILFAGVVTAAGAALAGRPWRALLALALAVGSLLAFGPGLLWLIPAWLFGVALAEWQRSRAVESFASRRQIVLAVLLAVSASAATTVVGGRDEVRFVLVGAAVLPLIHLMTCESPWWHSQPVRQAGRMGSWSYTLYVFHRPMVALAAAALMSVDLSSATAVAAVYLVSVGVTAMCYPAYFLGEHHTARVRAFLLQGQR